MSLSSTSSDNHSTTSILTTKSIVSSLRRLLKPFSTNITSMIDTNSSKSEESSWILYKARYSQLFDNIPDQDRRSEEIVITSPDSLRGNGKKRRK